MSAASTATTTATAATTAESAPAAGATDKAAAAAAKKAAKQKNNNPNFADRKSKPAPAAGADGAAAATASAAGAAVDQKSKPKQQQKPKQQPKSDKKAGAGCGCGDDPTAAADAKVAPKKKLPRVLPECPFEYFDSHTHLDFIFETVDKNAKDEREKALAKEKDESKKKAIADAPLVATNYTTFKSNFKGNYGGCLTVCCELRSIQPTLDILALDAKSKGGDGKVYASFGLHPHDSKYWTEDVEKQFRKVFAENPERAIAWGECGLDYFYRNSEEKVQQAAFTRQLQCAVELKKPIVVHSRDAEDDTLRIMKANVPADWPIHLHCFTGTQKMAAALIAHFSKLCIGFTGCITFNSATAQRETVKSIPIERLLLETDGPYMSPEPFRGAVAHPGHLPLTAAVMAECKGVSLEVLLAQVRKNTRLVYGI